MIENIHNELTFALLFATTSLMMVGGVILHLRRFTWKFSTWYPFVGTLCLTIFSSYINSTGWNNGIIETRYGFPHYLIINSNLDIIHTAGNIYFWFAFSLVSTGLFVNARNFMILTEDQQKGRGEYRRGHQMTLDQQRALRRLNQLQKKN